MHGGLENAKQTFLRLVKNSIYAHNISFIHSLCFNNQSALKYTTVQNKIKVIEKSFRPIHLSYREVSLVVSQPRVCQLTGQSSPAAVLLAQACLCSRCLFGVRSSGWQTNRAPANWATNFG